jgi:hypothetical protein
LFSLKLQNAKFIIPPPVFQNSMPGTLAFSLSPLRCLLGVPAVRYNFIVKSRCLRYTCPMDEAIVFIKSAFKHGVTEADIYFAFDNFLYEKPVPDESDKFLMLGADLWSDDRNANLLEIIYNRINENTIKVFHAMPCRPAWRKLGNI